MLMWGKCKNYSKEKEADLELNCGLHLSQRILKANASKSDLQKGKLDIQVY